MHLLTEAGLWTLAIVVVFQIANGALSGAKMLRLPFLAAATVGGWFLPQALGLMNDSTLPRGGLALTLWYATLCLVCIQIGDSLGAGSNRKRPSPRNFDFKKLLLPAIALSIIGNAAYSAIFTTDVQLTEDGLTTGFVTILYFFSNLQYFGLAVAFLIYLKTRSTVALVVVIFDLSGVLGFILFGGRRGPAIDVSMIVACILFFQRRWVPPRFLVFAIIVAAAFLGNSIGQYRSLVASINSSQPNGNARLPTLDELMNIQFAKDFAETTANGSYEARNAVVYMSAVQQNGNHDYGLAIWNYMVFRYIPGQFVGRNLKQAMQAQLSDNATEVYQYQRQPGSTFTGFADSFTSFWWFGSFVFVLIGFITGRLWAAASRGSVEAQLLYVASIGSGMLAITHSTLWFWAAWPAILVFYYPVFVYARRARKPVTRDLSSSGATVV